MVWLRRRRLYRPVWRLRRRRVLRRRLMRIVSSWRTAMRWLVGTVTSATSTAAQATRRVVSRRLASLKSPQAQLLSAVGGMCGGAWLIGPWMVGIVLMLGSAAWGVDAFLRDDGKKTRPGPETVLERYRNAA